MHVQTIFLSSSRSISTGTTPVIVQSYKHKRASALGSKKQAIVADTYYVQNKVIYPRIRTKHNRMFPELKQMTMHTVPNKKDLQDIPTLKPDDINAIAKATRFIAEYFGQPVCLHLVLRDVTMYLVNLSFPSTILIDHPTYIEPGYLKKVKQEEQAAIDVLMPTNEVMVIKNRTELILAQHLDDMITLLAQRDDPTAVTVGIVKEMPAHWSRQKELLEQLGKLIIYTSEFDKVRVLVEENRWPLVISPQQKILYHYKRIKRYFTLYQTINNGVLKHPIAPHVSVLNTFIRPLTKTERDAIELDEYFPGVRMEQLFDLMKQEPFDSASQAIKTLLFRLQRKTEELEITKREYEREQKPFDEQQIKNLQNFYQLVASYAYQTHQQLDSWHKSNKTTKDDLAKLFTISMLEAIVSQKPHEDILMSRSFTQLM